MLSWLALACRPHATTTTPPTVPAPTTPPPPGIVLVVSSYFSGEALVFDPSTGERIGTIEDLPGAQTVVPGPDGRWVACAENEDRIVIVDPETLAVVEDLVADDPATEEDETGGLVHPDAAVFGPDGRLYVSSFETDEVLRYEADGTFVDAVVAAGAGGLDGPDIGLTFGPTGELWVPGWESDRVHRYDPATGASLGDLLGPADGLDRPRAITVDSAGAVYVGGFGTGAVLRLDPGTSAVSTFATLPAASGLALDEAAGELLVSSGADDTVHAFSLATGEDLGVRIQSRKIDGVTAVAFLPR